MSFSISYEEKTNSHSGYCGLTFDEKYIKSIFPNVIYKRLYDIEGTNTLVNEFSNLGSTGFDESYLNDVFSIEDEDILLKQWRIGETLSELFLQSHRNARFYHHEIRDLKNIRSNSTGADLICFISIENECMFLFGEVKTSKDKSSPPKVLYHPTGMINQIENLAKEAKTRNQVIRYLAFKVKDTSKDDPFRQSFKKALKSYKHNKFHLIGVLVRDTEPTEKDLKSRFHQLKKDIDSHRNAELFALYIPIPMNEWGNLVASGRKSNDN